MGEVKQKSADLSAKRGKEFLVMRNTEWKISNAKRLIQALSTHAISNPQLKTISRILNYIPEQLQDDINDLEEIFYMLLKNETEKGENKR